MRLMSCIMWFGNHVAQSTGSIEVAATHLDANGFGIGDGDVIDVTAVPDGLEDAVAEAEDHDVLHGLFAEVMVDAVNLFFREHFLDVLI